MTRSCNHRKICRKRCRKRNGFAVGARIQTGAWMILWWSILLAVNAPALAAREETPPLDNSKAGVGFQRHRIPLQYEFAALYPCDLVFWKSSASGSQINSRTSILLYHGENGSCGGPIAFFKKPDQVYLSGGLALPFLLDMDHDGRTDLAMVNVEIGFWNIVRALIARKAGAEAGFYLMEPGGRYPSQPFTLESYDVTFSLGRCDHRPITACGDFNGDGLPDLLLSQDAETVGIHWGRKGGVWDDDSGEEWQDHMPIHPRRVGVHDLNGDGRDDLLFFYNRGDIRQMPVVNKSITVLISRFGIKASTEEDNEEDNEIGTGKRTTAAMGSAVIDSAAGGSAASGSEERPR